MFFLGKQPRLSKRPKSVGCKYPTFVHIFRTPEWWFTGYGKVDSKQTLQTEAVTTPYIELPQFTVRTMSVPQLVQEAVLVKSQFNAEDKKAVQG
jgi:hypothetical protein